MDWVNFTFTFGVSGMMVYSLGKRLLMAGRADARAKRAAVAGLAWESERRTLPIHRWYRVGRGAPRVMSRAAGGVAIARPLHAAESNTTTRQQNSNNGIATPTTDRNALLRETARCLAIVVNNGKMGETEGIRAFFGCAPSSSNPKYLNARAMLKEELEKLRNPYPNRTEEQDANRQELELSRTA